jgi:hypothetical protein
MRAASVMPSKREDGYGEETPQASDSGLHRY